MQQPLEHWQRPCCQFLQCPVARETSETRISAVPFCRCIRGSPKLGGRKYDVAASALLRLLRLWLRTFADAPLSRYIVEYAESKAPPELLSVLTYAGKSETNDQPGQKFPAPLTSSSVGHMSPAHFATTRRSPALCYVSCRKHPAAHRRCFKNGIRGNACVPSTRARLKSALDDVRKRQPIRPRRYFPNDRQIHLSPHRASTRRRLVAHSPRRRCCRRWIRDHGIRCGPPVACL